MRLPIVMLAFTLAIPTPAQNGENEWIGIAASAIQQSNLTLPGDKSFHLLAEIVETTNPTSEYKAKVEEYWVSPEKWQRKIESPGFSQTMVVNGDRVLEKDLGDYFPWWLNDLITAIFDPLSPVVGEYVVSPVARAWKPLESQLSSVCTTIQDTTDRVSLCFDPRRNLVTRVFSRNTGYGAEFNDFKVFGKKQIPRQIVFEPESGTRIQATVTELDELRRPDEQMFAVEQPTPIQDRITSLRIDQDTLRRLSLTSTEIDWPYVGGPVTGGCAVYVYADRSGHIREVWPGGCDNTGLENPLREQVMKWQLKTPISSGVPVQIESRLTFAFKMKLKPVQP
jgi:hypothetical protein